MGTGLNPNDPTIVAAFKALLFHQGMVVAGILLVVALGAWWRAVRLARLRAGAASTAMPPSWWPQPEPVGRRVLRVSFGVLWIFDGILQGQTSMPLGMTTEVIKPAAAVSPAWVQHLVNVGATIWSYHPISAPASAVWIQIGLGLWLVTAPRGNWSRLAGLASAGWGLVVWVFGESFGGIFAPGLTWLFGAPGAVLLYCVAGILVALPERAWTTARLGRALLAGVGAFFVGMAGLQAWPGRGFWQGQLPRHAGTGTLTAMVAQMSQTPQPHFLSAWLASFAGFDAAHGWGVNLFAVIALAVLGAAFLTGRPRLVRPAVVAGIVFCLADWVLVEDLGFLGGVGTDPNSMIPMALLFIAGYLTLTRSPATETAGAPERTPTRGQTSPRRWLAIARSCRQRWSANPTYAFRSLAAGGALGIVLVGAAPMALASMNRTADPILAQSIDGTPGATDLATPGFHLVDQRGQPVSLASLRGKTVALTFLDPVCVSSCPIIAQEFRMADGLLGADARQVELVAVNANPLYLAPDYLAAFDRQEGLNHLANWLYLTGSLRELSLVWGNFGVEIAYEPGGAMIGHSEIAYVIDRAGRTRYILDTDEGPGTSATKSSFAGTLADVLDRVLHGS